MVASLSPQLKCHPRLLQQIFQKEKTFYSLWKDNLPHSLSKVSEYKPTRLNICRCQFTSRTKVDSDEFTLFNTKNGASHFSQPSGKLNQSVKSLRLTHKARWVVIPHSLSIPKSFQQRVGLDDLILQSPLMKSGPSRKSDAHCTLKHWLTDWLLMNLPSFC